MMYRKLSILLVTVLILLVTAGCQNDKDITDANSKTQESSILNQTSETASDSREILALRDYRNNPASHDFEEGSLLNTASINLPHTTLTERDESPYNNEEELDILVQYINDTLNVKINNRWNVFVHYYDTDKTVGMVQFVYTVGKINTNRNILFNINKSKYDTVYYKCLTEDIDETDLTARINLFKSKYIQQKRELQEGETFYEEKTAFTYFIHADKLIYSYAYFFQYDVGVINNDWGTELIIDENGDAVMIP